MSTGSLTAARLRAMGLRPKKSWGQNFLIDENVLHQIVASLGEPERAPIVELGGGTGLLTAALGEAGFNVRAVERDRELVPLLEELARTAPSAAREGWLEVLAADAARLDYGALAAHAGGPLTVVGNLPYQLSGRILVSLAAAATHVRQAVVMVQREVGERLLAAPGSRTYGLLTVLVTRKFEARRVVDVPPGAFLPPPKVHSMVVRLTYKPLEGLDEARDASFVRVVRAAFGARRKMLRNALELGLKLPRPTIEAALVRAELEGEVRAETLSQADYLRLAAAFDG